MAEPSDAAAAALDGSSLLPNWPGGQRAALDSYCGLPEIEPLPDAEVIESLRMSVPQRTHRPSNLSTVTGAADSVAGFEGPGISNMCADIMRGRWLWIGELLVHDLGQFRCGLGPVCLRPVTCSWGSTVKYIPWAETGQPRVWLAPCYMQFACLSAFGICAEVVGL
jgi:hypothetical protein